MAKLSFEETASQVLDVMNASGPIAKSHFLRKYGDNETLRKVLQFIYNPYAKTGISDAKLHNGLKYVDSTGKFDEMKDEAQKISVDDVIKYFSEHTTGADNDCITAALFVRGMESLSPGFEMVSVLARALITHDLKIGATATTLNQVYGDGFIPKVGCMLGTHIDKVNKSTIKWPAVVTEKLDGIRRILVKRDGNVRMFSRSGHEDFGLVDIIEAAKHLPDNYVYDGELLAAGSFRDNIALRQATNSIANSKGIRHGLVLNVFDMIPLDQFDTGVSEEPAIVRKCRLAATLGDEDGLEILSKHPSAAAFHLFDNYNWAQMSVCLNCWPEMKRPEAIKPVEILGVIGCIEEATPLVEPIWERHGEGVMLNTASGLYEIKRSKELIKIKFCEEMTLTCVGFLEGSGKNEGTLGAIVVNYKGYEVGVGSGLTDAQRNEIWTHQSKYLGRQVEIDTFGESTNAMGGRSLNCPIFKRFVGDKE